MKGKEAKVYAIQYGTLELNANPKPKYMATIMQMIPIRVYCFVLKRNLSTSN